MARVCACDAKLATTNGLSNYHYCFCFSFSFLSQMDIILLYYILCRCLYVGNNNNNLYIVVSIPCGYVIIGPTKPYALHRHNNIIQWELIKLIEPGRGARGPHRFLFPTMTSIVGIPIIFLY